MFAACIRDIVKAGDRATDAAHLEGEKDADRLRLSPHDVVDQFIE